MAAPGGLEHSREDLGGHLLAVGAPVLLVLVRAALVITPSAVREQQGEVNGVEVGQRVREQRGRAPHEGGRHLGDVVEVSALTRERKIVGGQNQKRAEEGQMLEKLIDIYLERDHQPEQRSREVRCWPSSVVYLAVMKSGSRPQTLALPLVARNSWRCLSQS